MVLDVLFADQLFALWTTILLSQTFNPLPSTPMSFPPHIPIPFPLPYDAMRAVMKMLARTASTT